MRKRDLSIAGAIAVAVLTAGAADAQSQKFTEMNRQVEGFLTGLWAKTSAPADPPERRRSERGVRALRRIDARSEGARTRGNFSFAFPQRRRRAWLRHFHVSLGGRRSFWPNCTANAGRNQIFFPQKNDRRCGPAAEPDHRAVYFARAMGEWGLDRFSRSARSLGGRDAGRSRCRRDEHTCIRPRKRQFADHLCEVRLVIFRLKPAAWFFRPPLQRTEPAARSRDCVLPRNKSTRPTKAASATPCSLASSSSAAQNSGSSATLVRCPESAKERFLRPPLLVFFRRRFTAVLTSAYNPLLSLSRMRVSAGEDKRACALCLLLRGARLLYVGLRGRIGQAGRRTSRRAGRGLHPQPPPGGAGLVCEFQWLKDALHASAG